MRGDERARAARVPGAGIFIFGLFDFFPFFCFLGWNEKWNVGSPNSFVFLIFHHLQKSIRIK